MLVIIIVLIFTREVLQAVISYFLYKSNAKKLGLEPNFADYCNKSTFGKLNAAIVMRGFFGFIFLICIIFIPITIDHIEEFEKSVWSFDVGIVIIELNWIKVIAILWVMAYILEYLINDPKIRRKYFNQGPVTNSVSDLKRIHFENTLVAVALIVFLILFA
jgi:hypothetical protein